MDTYSVRDVERLLQLSRGTIRGLIDVGSVKPTRGARREYRFSFQDLIVLRAARALIEAHVPRRRIRRSLANLRRHLPDSVPLSGLSISAVGDQVVVREGAQQFHIDDGQYVLGLDVSVENGTLRVMERQPTKNDKVPASGESASDWFEKGLVLEEADPAAALDAYAHALALDPCFLAAAINRGRLLHERGDTRAAEDVYRRALEYCGPDAVLLFNLGVLLEDRGETNSALEAYQSAIGEDPDLADCHFNLARLYDVLGKPQHAIRHLGQYRRLVTPDHG